jgi:uncharacterized protein (DUF2147 family)
LIGLAGIVIIVGRIVETDKLLRLKPVCLFIIYFRYMKKLFPAALTLLFLGFMPVAFAQTPAKPAPKLVAAAKKMPEEEKINRLIKYVSGLEGATFIRNGEEHSAKDAAEHLQLKRRKAGSKVRTAREFIDELASESSLSGKAYQIRMKDGKTYSSREVLMKELNRIEQQK